MGGLSLRNCCRAGSSPSGEQEALRPGRGQCLGLKGVQRAWREGGGAKEEAACDRHYLTRHKYSRGWDLV